MRLRAPSLSVCAATAVFALVASGCGGDVRNAVASTASSATTSDTTPSTDGGNAAELAALKYVNCMRSHSVQMDDPGPNGNIVSEGDQPQAIVNRAAALCANLLPPARVSAQQNRQNLTHFLRFAHCMRTRGIPVADPIVGPNGAAGLSVAAGHGVDPNSVAFRRADAACKHYLPGHS
jgi:hypothetical protein